MSLFCNQCGAENIESASFCKECGYNLDEQKRRAEEASEKARAEAESQRWQEEKAKEEERRRKKAEEEACKDKVEAQKNDSASEQKIQDNYQNKINTKAEHNNVAISTNIFKILGILGIPILVFIIAFYFIVLTANNTTNHENTKAQDNKLAQQPTNAPTADKNDRHVQFQASKLTIETSKKLRVRLEYLDNGQITENIYEPGKLEINDERPVKITLGHQHVLINYRNYTIQPKAASKAVYILKNKQITQINEPEPKEKEVQKADVVADKNISKADSLQKACDNGDAKSCKDLGYMYEKGNGVEQDLSKAAKLHKKVCDGGSSAACTYLGFLYERMQEYSKAAELFKKTCNDNDALACSALGAMYEYGQGVARNSNKAVELYKKACDMGSKEDCKDYERLR